MDCCYKIVNHKSMTDYDKNIAKQLKTFCTKVSKKIISLTAITSTFPIDMIMGRIRNCRFLRIFTVTFLHFLATAWHSFTIT